MAPPLKRISIVVLLWILIMRLSSWYAYKHIMLAEMNNINPSRGFGPAMIIQSLIVCFIAGLVMKTDGMRISLAADKSRILKNLWPVMLFSVGISMVSFCWIWLINASELEFTAANLLPGNHGVVWMNIMAILLLAVIVPAVLEIVFHGVWYDVMVGQFGLYMAVIIIAIIYSCIFSVFGYYLTFMVCMASGAVRCRARSVLCGVIANVMITSLLVGMVWMHAARWLNALLYVHG